MSADRLRSRAPPSYPSTILSKTLRPKISQHQFLGLRQFIASQQAMASANSSDRHMTTTNLTILKNWSKFPSPYVNFGTGQCFQRSDIIRRLVNRLS